jgi:hypothetical protein
MKILSITCLLFITTILRLSNAAIIGSPIIDSPSMGIGAGAVFKDSGTIIKISPYIEVCKEKSYDAFPETKYKGTNIQGFSNMYRMSVAVNQNVEPFITVGFSKLQFEGNRSGVKYVVKQAPGFIFGTGLKLVTGEITPIGLKISGTGYLQSTNPKTIEVNRGNEVFTDSAFTKTFRIMDYGAGLSLSKSFETGTTCITPYVGYHLSWTSMDIKFGIKNAGLTMYDVQGDQGTNYGGIQLGFDYRIGKYFSINIEGLLLNETSIAGGFTFAL